MYHMCLSWMKFFPLTPVSISSHLEEMNKRREQPGNDVMNHCLYAVSLKFNIKQNHYGVGPTENLQRFVIIRQVAAWFSLVPIFLNKWRNSSSLLSVEWGVHCLSFFKQTSKTPMSILAFCLTVKPVQNRTGIEWKHVAENTLHRIKISLTLNRTQRSNLEETVFTKSNRPICLRSWHG